MNQLNAEPRFAMTGAIQRMAQVSIVALGWLLSYSYAIHLVGPYADTCAQGDDSAYALSLVWSAFTALVSGVLIAPGSVWGVRSRLFFIPHLGTLGLAVAILPRYITRVTVQGRFICAGSGYGDTWLTAPGAVWQRLFAPTHVLFLGGFLAWAWFRQNTAQHAG